MSSPGRAFVVTVGEGEAELVADRLWQLGVRAIEERSAGDGIVELWTAVGDGDDPVCRAAADAGWAWRTEEHRDDAPATWRDHVVPMPVGSRLLVVPAWRTGDDPPTGRTAVVIEPGAAFGLGDHPTSALCLEAVERELERAPGGSVLDVGCGTGILAIAALLLGAPAARGVDVAGPAVEAARANAARNGVADRLTVDDAPIADVVGRFDLVLANILAPALVAMASDLRRLTAPGGRLVVSGILADAHDHVLVALHPMRAVRTATRDGWAAVTLAHR